MSINHITRRGAVKSEEPFLDSIHPKAVGLVFNPEYEHCKDVYIFRLIGWYIANLGICLPDLIEMMLGKVSSNDFINNVQKSATFILLNLKIKTGTFLDNVFAMDRHNTSAIMPRLNWDERHSFRSNRPVDLRQYLYQPDVYCPNNVLLIYNRKIGDEKMDDITLWIVFILNDELALECDLTSPYWTLHDRDEIIRNVLKVTTDDSQTQIMYHNYDTVARLNNDKFINKCRKLLKEEREIDAAIDEFDKL